VRGTGEKRIGCTGNAREKNIEKSASRKGKGTLKQGLTVPEKNRLCVPCDEKHCLLKKGSREAEKTLSGVTGKKAAPEDNLPTGKVQSNTETKKHAPRAPEHGSRYHGGDIAAYGR